MFGYLGFGVLGLGVYGSWGLGVEGFRVVGVKGCRGFRTSFAPQRHPSAHLQNLSQHTVLPILEPPSQTHPNPLKLNPPSLQTPGKKQQTLEP